jgi:transaldolase/glucose-6-phosphate isomerase
MNPLKALNRQGQSVWLDFIRRSLIGRELQALIDEDGVVGITSNPAIFEKAIGHSRDYDSAVDALLAEGDRTPWSIYESLAIQDIQLAADQLAPVYRATRCRDGYVSLEVSPYLANDTEATIEEARRLWARVERPNLMVKVPGTEAGVPAIEALIGQGININVTLLFGLEAYEAVASAFIGGLERYAADHDDLGQVASVASFFISRIDTAVDARLETLIKEGAGTAEALAPLTGKTAIANAVMAYQRYKEIFSSDRWGALAERGGQTQRLLWASTGTKNPAYPDTLYVDRLIGPHTVNTMPPATMAAFRDHGTARATLDDDLDGAGRQLAAIARAGIALTPITDRLVADGVQLFADAADTLLAAVAAKRSQRLGPKLAGQTLHLPAAFDKAVQAELGRWREDGRIRRLWARDPGVWTKGDEAQWLGWLDSVPHQRRLVPQLELLAIAAARLRHVLLLGMGGSSLGPLVLAEILGSRPGHPRLHVLDSTDPAQIQAVEAELDLAATLVIVSSKSGTTLETEILHRYFFERLRAALGPEAAAKHVVAVTDPGSALQRLSAQAGFGQVFLGDPQIGGRYSVLSPFGLVPAAAIGIDIAALLDQAEAMRRSCGPDVPPTANPAVRLGVALGVAAASGRDKLTILAGPGLESFGLWAEQLVAESTGKAGRGLIPVTGESACDPDAYGQDRLFIHLSLAGRPDSQEPAVAALAAAGHPVVRITLAAPDQLAQEFFRWELATAVAGSILGINPFDQPDVEASKAATRALMAAASADAAPPAETPIFEADGIALFADTANAAMLAAAGETLEAYLAAHFRRLQPGDYAALLAYLPETPTTTEALAGLRSGLRERYRVATAIGFGPRFLHSTGQAYKGGPNHGVFLQLTCKDRQDLAVPQASYSFGTVKAAQAQGDFAVLAQRGRRLLRVHLGEDLAGGLVRLGAAMASQPN